MKWSMAIVAAAAVGFFFFADCVQACPASYVHGIGQQNANNANHGKANQVSEQYMTAKGVDPQSPAGQVIKPYVLGTTIVDDQWGIHSLQGKSVDQAVNDCMGCWHHTQHFSDGQQAANTQPPAVAPVKQGG